MLSLIYVSTASYVMSGAAVTALARQAAKHNAEHDVTGVLAYNTHNFMQLLEGEADNVLAIVRRIEADERHSGITYVRHQESSKRECPNWSMRSIALPLIGAGSSKVFASRLPPAMELDTKILFTSFASQLRIPQIASYVEAYDALASLCGTPAND